MESESDIKGDKKTNLLNKKKNQNLKKYYENSNSELDSEKEIKEKKQSTGLINISKYSEEHRSSSDYTDDSLESLFAALELDSKENDIKKSNKNRITDEEQPDNKLPKDKGIENEKVDPKNNFIIKYIEKDGNCFYRALSYFFRETEEDHLEFRELITNYILNNPGEYIFTVTDEDINSNEDEDEESKIKKKKIL